MKKILTFALALVMLSALLCVGAFATPASVDVGAEFDVDVVINDNSGIAYIEIPINYDSSLVEYVGSSDGALKSWTIGTKAVWSDSSNNTATGTVLTLKFKAIAAGNVTFSFGPVEAFAEDESDVAITVPSATVEIKPVPGAHEHNWVLDKETPATCTEAGQKVYKCSGEGDCPLGGTKTEEIQALGHKWGAWTVTTPATCTEKGVETRVCENDASHTENRDVNALGHKWGAWTVTTPATCTEKGVETRVCENDASHTENRDVNALGHKWGEWTETTPATCTEKGVETRVCANDASHTENRDVEKLEHEWVLTKVLKEPTETEEGEGLYTCKNGCGETKTDVIAKLAPAQTDNGGNGGQGGQSGQGGQPGGQGQSGKGGRDAGPKTGDNSNIALYAGILVLCGVGTVALIGKKKHNNG